MGFRILVSDFRVSGFGFRVSGFGCWVLGFGFRFSGLGFGLCSFRDLTSLTSAHILKLSLFGGGSIFLSRPSLSMSSMASPVESDRSVIPPEGLPWSFTVLKKTFHQGPRARKVNAKRCNSQRVSFQETCWHTLHLNLTVHRSLEFAAVLSAIERTWHV